MHKYTYNVYIHTDEESDTPRTRQDPLAHTRLSLKSIQKKSSQRLQQDGSANRSSLVPAEGECESPLKPAKDILAGTRLDRNSPPSILKAQAPSKAPAKRSETASEPVKGGRSPAGQQQTSEQNQNKKEGQGLGQGSGGANPSGHLAEECVGANTTAPKRNSGGFIARIFDFSLCASSRKVKVNDDGSSHREGSHDDESKDQEEKESKSQQARAAAVAAPNREKDASSSNPAVGTMATNTHAHVASSSASRSGATNGDQHQPCAHSDMSQGNAQGVPLWQIQNSAGAAQQAISRVGGDLIGMLQCGEDGRDTARSISMESDHDHTKGKLAAADNHSMNQRDSQDDHHPTEHLCGCLGFTLAKSSRKLCHVTHTIYVYARVHTQTQASVHLGQRP
jgi:hypothetical protein